MDHFFSPRVVKEMGKMKRRSLQYSCLRALALQRKRREERERSLLSLCGLCKQIKRDKYTKRDKYKDFEVRILHTILPPLLTDTLLSITVRAWCLSRAPQVHMHPPSVHSSRAIGNIRPCSLSEPMIFCKLKAALSTIRAKIWDTNHEDR